MFRPYRDVRFAKDKTPYKTHQGAFVPVGAATGWYVEIGSPGVRVGGGYYHAGGPDLARIRTAIDVEHSGEELQRIVAKLRRAGFEIRGDQLKTSPRGYSRRPPADRPAPLQVDVDAASYGFENLDTPDLLDRVRDDWRALRPLVELGRARVGRPRLTGATLHSRYRLAHRRQRPLHLPVRRHRDDLALVVDAVDRDQVGVGQACRPRARC